ncbi:MAG TPA: DUF962 domain-containing protein [Planktothrix sp.]|jgi:hypothetical protein
MTRNLQAHLEYYKSEHRTLGCKLTHMVGVPLIFLSLPAVLFSWRTALKLFAAGWGLQFIGHFCFEKNRPVLFSDGDPVMTARAAAIYVYDSWARLFSGRPLGDEDDEIDAEQDPDSIPEVIDLQKRVSRRRQAL